MNVEFGTEAPIFLFWEYLLRIFSIFSLQCVTLPVRLVTPLGEITLSLDYCIYSIIHCNQTSISVLPETKLHGLRLNFHIHVSVSE
jgi:hypothetical protein